MRVLRVLKVLRFLNNLRILIILNNLKGLRGLIFQIIPIVYPTLEHSFFDTSFGDKAILHSDKELVEHERGLMDEGDTQIGNLLVVHATDGLAIILDNLLASGVLPHLVISGMEITPLLHVANSKVVFIVVEQFFQTGFRHVG